MKDIDYKVFVPRGETNYVRFDGEEFPVDDIATVNIHLSDDRVTYWIYFKVPVDDYRKILMLKKGKTVSQPMILLLGNNPYEIHGLAEVQSFHYLKQTTEREVVVSFVIENASQSYKNHRKVVEVERSYLLDLED